MRSFYAFFKKEALESLRSGKLMVLGILFLLFGIMSPAVAKLTPLMFELMSDSLAEAGMVVGEVTVNALTSWTQFFKNAPIALIVFVLTYSGAFTREYESGTLILVLTKGLSRYKVVLAKTLMMLVMWTAGYWLCFGVTYGYSAYFWDNSIAQGLGKAAGCWWLFGVWIVCLIVLFSVLCKSHTGVLLGTGGCVLAAHIIGLFPKIADYSPSKLMNGTALVIGAESADGYLWSVVITAAMSVICIAVSVAVMNKKQL